MRLIRRRRRRQIVEVHVFKGRDVQLRLHVPSGHERYDYGHRHAITGERLPARLQGEGYTVCMTLRTILSAGLASALVLLPVTALADLQVNASGFARIVA